MGRALPASAPPPHAQVRAPACGYRENGTRPGRPAAPPAVARASGVSRGSSRRQAGCPASPSVFPGAAGGPARRARSLVRATAARGPRSPIRPGPSRHRGCETVPTCARPAAMGGRHRCPRGSGTAGVRPVAAGPSSGAGSSASCGSASCGPPPSFTPSVTTTFTQRAEIRAPLPGHVHERALGRTECRRTGLPQRTRQPCHGG